MTTHLVLGGVRSGKSRYAESLLAGRADVTYVAPGLIPLDDPDWRARVAAHRASRPAKWDTVESADLAALVAGDEARADDSTRGPGALLIDCLGTWMTRLIDDAGAWDSAADAAVVVRTATADLVAALRDSPLDVVVVSNEVGLGVVPAHASGRVFRDELGRLNAAVSAACDRVSLVVAGRVLDLSSAPVVGDVVPGGEHA